MVLLAMICILMVFFLFLFFFSHFLVSFFPRSAYLPFLTIFFNFNPFLDSSTLFLAIFNVLLKVRACFGFVPRQVVLMWLPNFGRHVGAEFWMRMQTLKMSLCLVIYHFTDDCEAYCSFFLELSTASFPIYVVEQKLGDLVITPSMALHQCMSLV